MKMLKLLTLFSILVFTMMACPDETTDCSDQITCSAWQKAAEVDGKCACVVAEGFCEEGKEPACPTGEVCGAGHKCEENACAGVTCGGHGTCELDDQEKAKCTCEEGYDLSSDKKDCTLSPECSAINKTGTCEKSCEVCNDGVCGPDSSGYLCDGGFNHLCNPAHDTAEGNTDCGSAAPYCAKDPDDETKGYCYNYGCKTDAECQTANYEGRKDDKFFCFQYGYTDGQQAGTSRHLDGVCMKAKSACTDVSRDGADYSACDDTCGDAQCNPNSWCMANTCVPECDPAAQINSCADGKVCKNINSADFPLYRCVVTVEEGEECGGLINCVDGTVCLGSDAGSWCLKTCNSESDTSCGTDRACHPYGAPGEAPQGYYCDGEKVQEVGEECSFAKDCLEGGVCLGTGSGDQYCMETCTAAAETSADCDGRKCIAYGQAPNNGFYCDAPHNVAIGDVCTLGSNCVDEAVCLGTGSGDRYCMEKCSATAETSSDCDGRKCNAYGEAPDNGFFCDAAADRNKLEACSLGHPCSGDLVCITHRDLETGYCFDGCKTDGAACSDERACQGVSETTTDGFCNEGCMVDSDCTVSGETCLDTFKCGVEVTYNCGTVNCTDTQICTSVENSTCKDKVEVDACTAGGTECDNNTNGKTVCVDLHCVVVTEVTVCTIDGNECAGNTNGKTACKDLACVVPVEVDACTATGSECAANTNGRTICVADTCTTPIEVDACTTNGNECAANTNNKTVCESDHCAEPSK